MLRAFHHLRCNTTKVSKALNVRFGVRLLSTHLDVTGNSYSVGTSEGLSNELAKGVELLDDAIINMISLQSDPVPQLRQVLEGDDKCGIAKCMLTFELLRNPPASYTPVTSDDPLEHNEAHQIHGAIDDEVKSLLLQLEGSFDELNEREQAYAAAALAWSQGKYTRCASLLEGISLNLNGNGDVLALRLAQDSYLALGDSKNALACIARSLQVLDDTHFLHGHLMGMMASGYLEVGKVTDAEETCARAVERSKGRDMMSLYTLLSTLQHQGRSSEVVATLDEHEEKHKGSGIHYLLYNKGCAHIQRGNYKGALRVYDSMIDLMLYRNDDDNNHRTAANATHATLLLWQICMNAQSTSDAHNRWGDAPLIQLWSEINLTKHNYPLIYDICKHMAFSAATSTLVEDDPEGINRSAFIQGGEIFEDGYKKEYEASSMKPYNKNDDIDNDKQVAGAGMVQGLYNYLTGVGTPEKQHEEEELQRKMDEEKKKDRDAFLALNVRQLHEDHIKAMNIDTNVNIEKGMYPRLEAMESIFPLETRLPEHSKLTNEQKEFHDKKWLVDTCGDSIVRGLSAYCIADYNTAADILTNIMPALDRLGGGIIKRDTFKHTLVEACLRSNRLTQARLLLCERTSIAPNEAQSWRRLASVFGRTGHQQLAEAAHYTSWQLGIAQGGFGGAR